MSGILPENKLSVDTVPVEKAVLSCKNTLVLEKVVSFLLPKLHKYVYRTREKQRRWKTVTGTGRSWQDLAIRAWKEQKFQSGIRCDLAQALLRDWVSELLARRLVLRPGKMMFWHGTPAPSSHLKKYICNEHNHQTNHSFHGRKENNTELEIVV